MDYRRMYDIATDNTFNERVAAALYSVALEVLNESSETSGHPLRVRTAQGFLMADVTSVRKYAAMVVASEPIASMPQSTSNNNITDAMISSALRTLWNPLSGNI